MVEDLEPLALLSRALEQAGSVIEATPKEQATLPTPCRSWDVRALVEHMIHDLRQFALAASGGRPEWRTAAPSVESDWADAFHDGARDVLAAWHDVGDLSRTVTRPIGEVPMAFVVHQQLAELAVHTWDLVTATGQPVDLDPQVAQAALDWARTTLRPEYRGDEASGKSFGPEVTVPADAPISDRLAAFFGRDPG